MMGLGQRLCVCDREREREREMEECMWRKSGKEGRGRAQKFQDSPSLNLRKLPRSLLSSQLRTLEYCHGFVSQSGVRESSRS